MDETRDITPRKASLADAAMSWRGWRLVFFLAVGFYVTAFCWLAAKHPLRMDEVDYFGAMDNAFRLGVPLYYAGEVNYRSENLLHLFDRSLAGQPYAFYRFKPETGILKETFFALSNNHSRYTYGLWHPPLYIYLGAPVVSGLGLTPATSATLRGFNLLFVLGVFAGLYLLSHRYYGPSRGTAISALAAWLYALTPWAIPGSLLIDYNATLGPCVALWFAVALTGTLTATRWPSGTPSLPDRYVVSLTLLAALAWLTSLGIGLCLTIAAASFTLLAPRRLRRKQTLVALVAGGLLFVVFFWLLCLAVRMPFSQPFLHNWQRLGARPNLTWLYQQSQIILRYLTTYAFAAGLALSLSTILLGITALKRHSLATFLPVSTLVAWVAHGFIGGEAYGVPKYILFTLPLMCVFVSGQILTSIITTGPGNPRPRWVARLANGWLIVLLSAQAIQMAALISQPGSILYQAHEEGTVAIAQELAPYCQHEETILAPKDIAFYAGCRFVQLSSRHFSDARILEQAVTLYGIRAIVANHAALNAVAPEVRVYLDAHFPVQTHQGDLTLRGAP